MVGATAVPIHYQKVKPVVCRVILHTDTEIEPGTDRIVGGRLEIGFERNSGNPGRVEDLKTLRKNKEFSVGRSLVVPKNGDTRVCVANFTDKPIKLPTGHVIGFYHPLSIVNGETTSVQVDVNVPQDLQSKCSNQTVDSEGKVNAKKDNRS